MTDRRAQILNAPLVPLLASLAWPIALSNEISILSQSVVLFWLGNMLGSDALAAESLVRPLMFAATWMFAITATGSGVLIARSVGRGDDRGLHVLGNGTALTVALWAIIGIPGVIWSDDIVGFLTSESLIQGPAATYLGYWMALALPLLALAEVLLDAANATGWTRLGLMRIVLDLAILAVITPLLLGPLDAGIQGLAFAVSIACALLIALLLPVMLRRREQLRIGSAPGVTALFDLGLWRNILSFAAAPHIAGMFMFLFLLFLASHVSQAGPAAVAGYGLGIAFMMFVMVIVQALSQAGAIVVAQSIGAERPDRARETVKTCTRMAAGLVAVLFVPLYYSGPLAGVFTDDSEVVAAVDGAMRVIAIAVVPTALWRVLMSVLIAAGASNMASACTVISYGICTFAIHLLPIGDPIIRAAWALALAGTIKFLCLIVLTSRVFFRQRR